MKFKRLMALAMAGLLTFAMAGSVYADPEDEPVAESEAAVTTYTTFDALIQKTVIKNDNVEMPEITFTFEFAADAENTMSSGDAPAIEDVTIAYTASSGNVQTGGFDEDAVFGDNVVPGCYAYTITETELTDEQIAAGWTAGGETYTLRVYKEFDGDIYYTIQNEAEEKTDVAEFENTYIPVSSMTVSKTVENPQWSSIDSYAFELTFTTEDEFIDLSEYSVTVGDDEVALDQTVSFELTDGGEISLEGIPAGISYTISETNVTGTANYEGTDITVGEETTSNATSVDGTVAEDANDIAFLNKYTDIPITGLALNIAPFVAMFAAVAGAIALYVAAKRRVR